MQKRAAGFTLIEILLVLVLLASSAVAVIISMPESKEDAVKEEAARFRHLVQLLGEESLLNGRDYGIRVERDHYQFLQLTSQDWEPMQASRFFTRVEMPEDIRLNVEIGSYSWQDNDRLFKPGSLFDEDLFAEQTDKDKIKPPQVVVMASGEYTPFTLEFEVEGENQFWRVQADELGQLYLLPPGESIESLREKEEEWP
ncbi:type II secretion system minor pseudopilin GspH [Photobacterium aphoticum]|uniref:Type II secretion system protein H n=1 Tax=Photobacterium aphoticum TaxID=754436 RepID=A0A0J1GNY1_9GAMM|nr:type II secretion system minor pseudopilin GspH [Photobacterium aphoticum]KLV01311.1 general secretion pathway protein GspH [Photobacterium aphoticum]PSU54951.1 type II secretion system protein GspH [Photobacterium aphoticum]GHA61574.1 type II secretion system protein GspH [Photobacterium aphoticum]